MFIYEIATGKLFQEGGTLVGSGYSGKGDGLNNPDMTWLKDIGPIPVGFYTIGQSYHHLQLGPVTMNLTPDEGNEMFNRDEFRIHGDNAAMNKSASEGCIIQGRATRETVDADGQRRLQVVARL